MNLSEAQVQALALSRQASQELDVKRREAIYNDVLTKQQMVRIQSMPGESCGQKSLVRYSPQDRRIRHD